MLNKIYNIKFIVISLFNICIFNTKKKIKNKKIYFFYFPTRSFDKNIFEIIKNLKKDKKNVIFFGYYRKNYNFFLNKKNSFLINNRLLFLLRGVDVFFSAYITSSVPQKSKSFYMHHDILDTTLVGRENEAKTLKWLNKYNYVLTSSNLQTNFFKNLYKKNNIKCDNLFINIGYPKLEYNLSNYKKIKIKKNFKKIIFIAPGPYDQNKEQSLYHFLKIICEVLLENNKKLKIIIRPHPLDLYSHAIIRKLLTLKKNYQNKILIDKEKDYLKKFKSSLLLISDISGICYTYAFTTLKPVLFYNNFKNFSDKNYFKKLFYYKLQNIIGFRFHDEKSLEKAIHEIQKKKSYGQKTKSLRNQIIIYKDPIKRISRLLIKS